MNSGWLNISDSAGQTKVLQLVHAITEAISTGKLKAGDALPSINQLSKESGYSRDTIFKAYNILKQRNVIESTPTKGYYVANESFRILMLLDDFSAFKEQLYQSFRKNMPESYSVDLLFHHYNKEVFNQLIQNSLGRYNSYIVMNISNKNVAPILQKIDANKLLILDMGNPEKSDYNFIVQDFKTAVKSCLDEGAEKLKKYRELILLYSEDDTPHPAEIIEAVKQFCKENGMIYSKMKNAEQTPVKPGSMYFVIRDADLVQIIKTCRQNNYKLGKDIGVLSYNDTPMKQIVGNGISVISTDFTEMGRLAAEFIKNKQRIRKTLPTFLTLRDSL